MSRSRRLNSSHSVQTTVDAHDRRVRVERDLEIRDVVLRAGHRLRVVADDRRPFGQESSPQRERGRESDVVGPRLEGQPEQRDTLAFDVPETFTDLLERSDDRLIIETLDLPDQRELVVASFASRSNASRSFGKQNPPYPKPALRNARPILGSDPMTSAIATTSAPVRSQIKASPFA